jgi:ribonuclease HI
MPHKIIMYTDGAASGNPDRVDMGLSFRLETITKNSLKASG